MSLHTDRDSRQLHRDCNVFGKPVYEKATDAEGKNPSIRTWHYDSLGKVSERTDQLGYSETFQYDEEGSLKEKHFHVIYNFDKSGSIQYT